MTDEALNAVERANELLDEVERFREEWERSREIIESAKQMRIAADGYISSLEEANKALAECVNGALEEMERLQKVNKEIAKAAKRGMWAGEFVAPWDWRKGKRLD